VIVAHRLPTVQQAHNIAVLEAGRVLEFGPPPVLAASGGAYARLLAAYAGEGGSQ
jgi:ABC-type multidrug transport system fused ATPase/permease subunit